MNRFALLLLPWLVTGAAHATDETASALERWLAAQTAITHWQAEVVQVRALKGLARPLRSPGRAWISQPGRMRWELGQPPKTIAVRNGDVLVVSYPALEQVERYGLDDEMNPAGRQAQALLEAGFPADAQTFHEKYALQATRQEEGRWLFDLTPRAEASRKLLRSVRLEVAAEDWRLLATEFAFPDGSQMRNEFSGHRLGAEPDPALFEIAAP